MNRWQPSRTAEYMAFFRAAESVRPANRRLFEDRFAVRFIRPRLRWAVWLSKNPVLAAFINWYADHRLPGARTSAVARTRFVDDALRPSLAKGIGQLVILGAGFDCRAYRLAELQQMTVFEVDHPATLSTKLQCLRQVLPGVPEHVRFVESDFNRLGLAEALRRAGFEPSRPAVFLWEGVTNYLTAEAVDSVLRYVACCSTHSEIIFTYVHSGILDGSVDFDRGARLLQDVARLGEPWTFGLSPARLADFLDSRGLCLDRDLSAGEYRTQYFGAAAQRMKGYEFYHIAAAHVSRGDTIVQQQESSRA
ncbi:MAG TPA: SAM-dependent methyltransferase [Candidatus Saccharimonadales bacterium]|nr:SAM-dependent methyltransferase [Candidatus Saccharimonadales bacterium]